jgi:hypothetical protein
LIPGGILGIPPPTLFLDETYLPARDGLKTLPALRRSPAHANNSNNFQAAVSGMLRYSLVGSPATVQAGLEGLLAEDARDLA